MRGGVSIVIPQVVGLSETFRSISAAQKKDNNASLLSSGYVKAQRSRVDGK